MRRLYRSSASQDDVQAWCASRLEAWPVPHTVIDVPTILGQTHVVAAGEGDRVCVFVPGTNFNAATSLALLGALAERVRVYAVDLPGQPGLSAADRPSDEQLGYSQWVTDLLRWVREHEAGSRDPGRRALPRRGGRAVGAAGPRRRCGGAEPGRHHPRASLPGDARREHAVAAEPQRRRVPQAAGVHVGPGPPRVRGPGRVDDPGLAIVPHVGRARAPPRHHARRVVGSATSRSCRARTTGSSRWAGWPPPRGSGSACSRAWSPARGTCSSRRSRSSPPTSSSGPSPRDRPSAHLRARTPLGISRSVGADARANLAPRLVGGRRLGQPAVPGIRHLRAHEGTGRRPDRPTVLRPARLRGGSSGGAG